MVTRDGFVGPFAFGVEVAADAIFAGSIVGYHASVVERSGLVHLAVAGFDRFAAKVG